MTLERLKELLGIPLDETSQDVLLQLYLEVAMEQAVTYCDLFEWDMDPLNLPATIEAGIVRIVQIKMDVNSRAVGVVSESIGGMSKSYGATVTPQAMYADVLEMWKPYHRFPSIFRSARYAHTQGGGI